MRQTLLLAAAFLVGLAGFSSNANAFSYSPTAISQSLRDHELVFVGQVIKRSGGGVRVAPVKIIKGDLPSWAIDLPDTWRPGTEWSFGPRSLGANQLYLFMLNRGTRGEYYFSRDFAAQAVEKVDSENAAIVQAVEVLHQLKQTDDSEKKRSILARATKELNRAAKRAITVDFYASKPDPDTVPFLLAAIENANWNQGPAQLAGYVIRKHQYREAIPGLIEVVQKRKGAVLVAAETLGELKAQQAYEPMLKLVEGNEPVTGNAVYFFIAFSQLDDQRSIPILLNRLHRNQAGLDPRTDSYRTWSIRENEAAAAALGRLKAAEAVVPLRQVLDIGHNELRSEALDALGKIGPPARPAIPKIRELMASGTITEEAGNRVLEMIKDRDEAPEKR